MIAGTLSPMLAHAAAQPFDSEDYLFEVKWDGIRAIVYIDEAAVRIQSRGLMDMTGHFPEFQTVGCLPAGTVLDGEIVILSNGKPCLQRVLQRLQVTSRHCIQQLSQSMPAVIIAFDLLVLRGRSTMMQPLIQRRERLVALLAPLQLPCVILSEAFQCRGSDLFRAVHNLNLEGIMAKRQDSPYLPGKRSRHWLKIKCARFKPTIGASL